MSPRAAFLVAAALLLAACSDSRSADSPRGKGARSGSAAAQPEAPKAPDDFTRHVAALKRKIARLKGDFTVVVEGPFVLVGDCDEERLRHIGATTVRWTREKLRQDFFAKDPTRILDIFLFKDADSYEAYVHALTGRFPTTPYGFYSSNNGALYMNIRTGLGTLVHEIVHPYIEANYSDCPPWLNEGLGSLFEQADERDGHIIGRTNWRLRELKASILDGKVPPFHVLTAMDAETFYGPGSSVHYAAARYLLYYLQERGLLVQYYRAAFEAREADPTGYKTLVRVLGEKDMDAFERRWVEFVNGLSFP